MRDAISLSQALNARTIGLTVVAMVAFAANSVLCRLALAQGAIDPASFTLIRIGAGTVMLWLILAASGKPKAARGGWSAALSLFTYAAAFSFAYVSLTAGAGALLLFGAVQATMVATGLVRGERPSRPQTLGFVLALAGLVALLLPGASAPPLVGAALMIVAGVAWGAYSLLGRAAADPLAATAGNFLRAPPLAALVAAATAFHGWKIAPEGVIYAALSGAVASGLGYSIWYAALRGLSPVQAASVQLSVPVLAALAGTATLGEAVSLRFALSSIAILGGIALVIAGRKRLTKRPR